MYLLIAVFLILNAIKWHDWCINPYIQDVMQVYCILKVMNVEHFVYIHIHNWYQSCFLSISFSKSFTSLFNHLTFYMTFEGRFVFPYNSKYFYCDFFVYVIPFQLVIPMDQILQDLLNVIIDNLFSSSKYMKYLPLDIKKTLNRFIIIPYQVNGWAHIKSCHIILYLSIERKVVASRCLHVKLCSFVQC